MIEESKESQDWAFKSRAWGFGIQVGFRPAVKRDTAALRVRPVHPVRSPEARGLLEMGRVECGAATTGRGEEEG
jgi:hypothetical protein